jgi:hypothetical protein
MLHRVRVIRAQLLRIFLVHKLGLNQQSWLMNIAHEGIGLRCVVLMEHNS